MKNSKCSVLVIDDEEGICSLLKEIISESGHRVEVYHSPEKGLSAAEQTHFDIAIVDLKMQEIGGIEVLKILLKEKPDTAVVMMTAYGSVENAVECIKLGAFDFITKPFQADEIKILIDKIIERNKLVNENIILKQKIDGFLGTGSGLLTGRNKKVEEIRKFCRKISSSKQTVLITGESGTGKEMVARYIHECSPRNKMRFETVQCSLIPENLFESELFGHKKGSFTGATEDRAGLLEAADGGTVFLDEIGDTGMNIQGKLLRFLQEKEARRVGDNRTKVLDVRLIAATNKKIEQLIKINGFREDLYYRLKVITIEVPPLRQRKEDIPLLAETFIDRINQEQKLKVEIDSECMKYLQAYEWPGNVRELRNCIETAVTVCEKGHIKANDIISLLPREHVNIAGMFEGNVKFKEAKAMAVGDFERRYIENLLLKNGGNISKSAKEAGMNKKNFWMLMKKNDIDAKSYKA